MVRDASPDVSVIIPTYNRKELLQQAITSCFAGNEALDVEVVVVDDGSTDGTREYLEQLDDDRIRPILQEHRGGQHARNRGLEEAEGEYVKFLDDDDWLAPNALVREVYTLRESQADVCSGGCQFVGPGGQELGEPSLDASGTLVQQFLENEVGPQPLRHTYRREKIMGLEWDEDLPCRQDYAFLMEVALQDPSHVVTGEISGFKRQHEEGLSEREESKRKGANVHLSILFDAAQYIQDSGRFGEATRRVLAQKLWAWGRIVAVEDWQFFVDVNDYLEEFAPGFKPSRRHLPLRAIDAVLGRVGTEKVTRPLRKAISARA